MRSPRNSGATLTVVSRVPRQRETLHSKRAIPIASTARFLHRGRNPAKTGGPTTETRRQRGRENKKKKNKNAYLVLLRLADCLSSCSALQELSPLHLQRRPRLSQRRPLPRDVCLHSLPRLCLGPNSMGPTRLHLALGERARGGGVFMLCMAVVNDHGPLHPYNAGTEYVGFHRPERHCLHQR